MNRRDAGRAEEIPVKDDDALCPQRLSVVGCEILSKGEDARCCEIKKS
jgi:hypothetical protein